MQYFDYLSEIHKISLWVSNVTQPGWKYKKVEVVENIGVVGKVGVLKWSNVGVVQRVRVLRCIKCWSCYKVGFLD